MKNRIQELFIASALLALFTFNLQPTIAHAQGTAFIYQGRLLGNGQPASGIYNLQFTIFDSATNGNVVAGPTTNTAVAVSNGLFTVILDFGATPWNGESNWLQIAVETNSPGATFTSLTPRQPVAPVPYAIYAESGGTATALASGTALGAGSGNRITNGVSDAFIGGGSGNVIQGFGSYSLIGGGCQNTNNGGYATVDGGYGNAVIFANYATVSGGLLNIADGFAAAVAGGNRNKAIGSIATVGGGQRNAALGSFATVAGGSTNTASGLTATVSGGYDNVASGILTTVSGGQFNRAGGDLATVGGGDGNTATGVGSFIGGGGFNGVNLLGNVNRGVAAVIGGGLGNSIQTNADYAFIGGGYHNTASGVGSFIGGGGLDRNNVDGNINQGVAAAIVGGVGNLIQTNANYAFIGGGYHNAARTDSAVVVGGTDNSASGEASYVGGGLGNTAGASMAVVVGGQESTATGVGSFIGGGWRNTASGVYATVGAGAANAAMGYVSTVPGGKDNVAYGDYSFAAGEIALATNRNSFVWSDGSATTSDSTNCQFVARASGGFVFYTSTANTGVALAPGSGSWSMMSDRNAKDDFAPVHSEALLAKVASLPVTTWSYKTERGVRHIGPMAQDFYAAFKVGEDNKHIADVDEGGVALAAIQGLNRKVNSETAALRADNARLQSEVEHLQRVVAQLSEKLNGDEYAVTRKR